MGRGRQKAKQTKVARELKYFSPNTDYDALAKELRGGASAVDPVTGPAGRTDGFDVGEGEVLDDTDDDRDRDEDDDSGLGIALNGR